MAGAEDHAFWVPSPGTSDLSPNGTVTFYHNSDISSVTQWNFTVLWALNILLHFFVVKSAFLVALKRLGGAYRIITYISSPALVCNIGEGIDINVLMLYVFCL